jgi:hypothetical protein
MSQEADLVRQKHSVKVNQGSGVLIRPMNPNYAYVLTAKHCLKVDSQNLDSAEVKPHVVTTFDGQEVTVLDVIFHDDEDMAIMIVDSGLTLELMINSDSLKTNEDTFLCGYPEDRRTTDEEYKAINYLFSRQADNRLILTPKTAGVVHSNVVGFSGGGIFTIGDNEQPVLLCAVETKMDGNVGREYQGAISAIPISEFNKFIEDPQTLYLGKPLSPILPLYLSNFKHLFEFSFDVLREWADDDALNLLQGCLRDIAKKDIKLNIFPHDILVKLKIYLKVYNRPESELYSRGLWVSLLELLTISILIDKPKTVDITYVEAIFQSRRLMYLGGEGSWREYLSNILQSGLEKSNHQGIVVTKTLSKSSQASFTKEFVEKAWKLQNMARPSSDPKKIINANKSLSNIHSIVDLSALHVECIQAKEVTYENHTNITEFDENNETELLMLLAKEYGNYLTVKGIQDA